MIAYFFAKRKGGNEFFRAKGRGGGQGPGVVTGNGAGSQSAGSAADPRRRLRIARAARHLYIARSGSAERQRTAHPPADTIPRLVTSGDASDIRNAPINIKHAAQNVPIRTRSGITGRGGGPHCRGRRPRRPARDAVNTTEHGESTNPPGVQPWFISITPPRVVRSDKPKMTVISSQNRIPSVCPTPSAGRFGWRSPVRTRLEQRSRAAVRPVGAQTPAPFTDSARKRATLK